MISANVISGPFFEVFAEAAYESILPLVDEIVVVDTAPGDNPNHKVNKKYATSVLHYHGGGTKDFSFADARELARVNSRGDWILKWDQDEVIHENDIPIIRKAVENTKRNCIEFAFYHFMVYPWLYQFVDTKKFMFLKEEGEWRSNVHEGLYTQGNRSEKLHEVKIFHYGYLRGQEEVFKRWVLYAEIVGKPTWYNGQDPSNIITDRISVCQNFTGEHPKVAQGVLTELFKDVSPFYQRQIPRYNMSARYVGLLLLTHNDSENLIPMLKSLEETLDYPTVIHHIDMGSNDMSAELVESWACQCKNPNLVDCTTERWNSLYSLAMTQNEGFKKLMARQECDLIGWIHPDMLYAPGWLSELVATIQSHPEIGKICSFNTREGGPNFEGIAEGQEQAYVIQRGILFQIGLFDEDFIGIGGYEDWDMNNRIRREGLKVAITSKSLVWHKGMATRERRDTSEEQMHNRGVYYKKWGAVRELITFE
jgi:glycosyltransferase involved in cell wall biosynthesis